MAAIANRTARTRLRITLRIRARSIVPGSIETLGTRLSRVGRVDPDSALLIARDVARALGLAHAGGMVHGQLAPDKLLLVRDPGAPQLERVELVDFARLGDGGPTGIARPLPDADPRYMSPEQCLQAARVDHRADLYSLGCVLFHAACGHPPFTSRSRDRVVAAQIRSDPWFPPQLQLPEGMIRLIQRLLDKSPARRFQSAAELVVAIGEVRSLSRAA